MKTVVYTCITGGYDVLRPVPDEDAGRFDFVCFTDDMGMETFGQWKLRPMPSELDGLSDIKKQRVVKICPHRYLPEYEASVWIDANIGIVGNLYRFINKNIDFNVYSFWTKIHPSRKTIFEEINACIKYSKDNTDIMKN